LASYFLRTDVEIYIDYNCNVSALLPYFGISPLISSQSHIQPIGVITKYICDLDLYDCEQNLCEAEKQNGK